MDKDISNWTMEFLLRSSVPDSIIEKTLTALPLSATDSRLKITVLLRTLQSQLVKASLSESSLQVLELLETLYRKDAVPISDSMRRAYCALAVECTVKYLITCHDNPSGEYFSAVRRIWRGRVVEMSAEGRKSELLCDELNHWGEEVEAALWDVRVSERLVGLNTRRDAMNEMKSFLKEAWGAIGPSFLGLMGKFSDENRLCTEGVCEIASGSEVSRKRGRVESLGKEKINDDGDGENDNDNVNDDSDGDGETMHENHSNVQLEKRVGTSYDGNQEVGGCDSSKGDRDKEIQNDNRQLQCKPSSNRTDQRGVRILGAEEAKQTNLSSKCENLPSAEVKRVRESLKSSSMELKAMVKDPLPDALRTSGVVRSELATKDSNCEPPIENQSKHVDVPDLNTCKTMVLYQPNDVNIGKKSSVHCSNSRLPRSSVNCSNSRRPSLMERASSARAFEWNDSIDNAPPPKKKKRKWTLLEEDTLRAGVKEHGEGNWRTIRDSFPQIFQFRSGVDLKDKWRNMIR